MPNGEGFRGLEVTVPLRKPTKYEVMLPQIVEMTEAGGGAVGCGRLALGRSGGRRPLWSHSAISRSYFALHSGEPHLPQ
jgi:hypothetical protein